MPFDSPDLLLSDILKDIALGDIQLPDFQREWKWDAAMISSLLASISQGHPVGVLMLLEVGGEDGIRFLPRPLAGVSLTQNTDPETLILDGQQRLTSLYQSLRSGNAVDTKDPRGKKFRRWFYVDIANALDVNADREEAIVAIPEDKKQRNFRNEIIADYSTTEQESAAELFPLSIIFESGAIFDWQAKYVNAESHQQVERMDRWKVFYESVLKNFIHYTVPVIILKKETPKEAVCLVFEKVNTGGVALNVFELLTATFAAENFRLNDDWKTRQERLFRKPVLKALESTDFLQAVTLLATRARRRDHLSRGGSVVDSPGISCKRKEILRLSLDEYRTWAEPVTSALEWAASFLAKEHVYEARDLPYHTQLVPLAALRVAIGPEAETHGVTEKIRQWYWCGILGELYGSATDTRFARDVGEVEAWINGGSTPSTIEEAVFSPGRLLTLKTRNSAAFKGLYALLMRNGCLDWLDDREIDYATFFEYNLDIHHIFPRVWCRKNEIDESKADCIVNKTAISSRTNRSIGGRAPSIYLPTLESRARVDSSRMDEILRSHVCDSAALRMDDFDTFFEIRREALLDLISNAMGTPIVEDELSTESPEAFEEEEEAPLEQLEDEIFAQPQSEAI